MYDQRYCVLTFDCNGMQADEAHYIGPAPSRESYLRMDKIIEVAKATGAQVYDVGACRSGKLNFSANNRLLFSRLLKIICPLPGYSPGLWFPVGERRLCRVVQKRRHHIHRPTLDCHSGYGLQEVH